MPQSLFGTSEKKSSDISAFTRWTNMLKRFNQILHGPQVDAAAWNAAVASFRTLAVPKMIVKVNDFMNAKPYRTDLQNWGVTDYWSTPNEFLQRGGDCEDFVIAKYFALSSAGLPDSLLRVVIVQDLQKNIPHAILACYATGDALILDNQIKAVTKASGIKHYKPIYSINREAWWYHGPSPIS